MNKKISAIILVSATLILNIYSGASAITGEESGVNPAENSCVIEQPTYYDSSYDISGDEYIIQSDALEMGEVWDGTVGTAFSRGSGTQSDPYIIERGEDLSYLAKTVNGDGCEPVNYEGVYFNIVKTISLNNTNGYYYWSTSAPTNVNVWKPIGTPQNPFNGILNGGGNTIYGVYVGDKTSDYTGLFGYVTGNIDNIKVKESCILGKDFVGGIAGYIGSDLPISVNLLYFSGIVSAGNYVGGIVGYLEANNASVDNSQNGKLRICESAGTVIGKTFVGGIAGINSERSEISDCACSAEVVISDNYGGGITGDNRGTTISCFFNGKMSGSGKKGAIIGRGVQTLNCYYSSSCGAIGDGISLSTSQLASTDVSYALNTVNGVYEQYYSQNDFFDNSKRNSRMWGHNGKTPVLESVTYPAILTKTGNIKTGSPDVSWYLKGTPYRINTAEGLLGLAYLVNSGINSFENIDIELSGDVDLSALGVKFTSIGTALHPFCGNFGGMGHVISGIQISSNADNQGLFGYADKGLINDIGVINSTISTSGVNCGAIVGYLRGQVVRCLSSSVIAGSENVGGIIGYTKNTGADFAISACQNTGSVSSTGDNTGGIVGYLEGKLKNCINNGEVTGANNVGGIAGNGSGAVTYTYNTGNITGTSRVDRIAGMNLSLSLMSNFYLYKYTISGIESGIVKTSTEMSSQTFLDLMRTNDSVWESRNNGYDYPLLIGVPYIVGHIHSYSTPVTTLEATCITAGVKSQKCVLGGCEYELTQAVAPTGIHNYDNWIIDKAATCVEDGTRHCVCKTPGCGNKKTETVPKTGVHKFDDTKAVITRQATGITDGLKTNVCLVCNQTINITIPKTGLHYFDGAQWVTDTLPTCTEKGRDKRTCTDPGCNECEYRVVDELGHEAGEWQIVSESTCTVAGKREKRCTRCAILMESEELPLKAHTAGEWNVIKEPTCTVLGSREKRCVDCGVLLETDNEVPMIEHTPGAWELSDEVRNCQSTEQKKFKKCTVCGATVETGVNYVPASKHIWSDWGENPEYGTTEEAQKYIRVCVKCGETEYKNGVSTALIVVICVILGCGLIGLGIYFFFVKMQGRAPERNNSYRYKKEQNARLARERGTYTQTQTMMRTQTQIGALPAPSTGTMQIPRDARDERLNEERTINVLLTSIGDEPPEVAYEVARILSEQLGHQVSADKIAEYFGSLPLLVLKEADYRTAATVKKRLEAKGASAVMKYTKQ